MQSRDRGVSTTLERSLSVFSFRLQEDTNITVAIAAFCRPAIPFSGESFLVCLQYGLVALNQPRSIRHGLNIPSLVVKVTRLCSICRIHSRCSLCLKLRTGVSTYPKTCWLTLRPFVTSCRCQGLSLWWRVGLCCCVGKDTCERRSMGKWSMVLVRTQEGGSIVEAGRRGHSVDRVLYNETQRS